MRVQAISGIKVFLGNSRRPVSSKLGVNHDPVRCRAISPVRVSAQELVKEKIKRPDLLSEIRPFLMFEFSIGAKHGPRGAPAKWMEYLFLRDAVSKAWSAQLPHKEVASFCTDKKRPG